MKYPVIIDENFVVSFPDIPEALTQGSDLADALEMGKDALETALEFYFESGRAIPFPSAIMPSQHGIELGILTEGRVYAHNSEFIVKGEKQGRLVLTINRDTLLKSCPVEIRGDSIKEKEWTESVKSSLLSSIVGMNHETALILQQPKLQNIFEKQKEFLDKAGNADPALYARFIEEEYDEFQAAFHGEPTTREHIVQEACDLLFVTVGELNSLIGVDKAAKAFDILCDVNMKKFGGDLRDENGKVVLTKERKAELKAEVLERLKELCDEG